MSSQVSVRETGTAWRVVIDGQSLTNAPIAYPLAARIMSGRKIPWENVFLNNTGWADLISTINTRLLTQVRSPFYDDYLLFMLGGTTDVASGLTGAQIYAAMETYADAARAGGFTQIVACTINKAVGFDSAENTERLDANARIMADAGNAFDAQIDLDVAPLLDPTDLYYSIDGIHYTALGAEAAKAIIDPVLDAILEDNMITPDNLTSFNAAYGSAITTYDQEFEAVSSSLPAGWSWLNQGTATYQEHLGAGVVTLPAGSGVNWRGITRTLPSESTWTATAKITASGKYVTGNYIGLLVRESSSGKFIPMSRYMAAPGGAGDENVYTDRWTNVTTYGAAIANATMFDRAIYFRIRQNSATSYDFETSADGLSWMPLSMAYDLSAYMTPDQIGLAGNFQGNALGGFALQWFRVR